MARRVDVFYAFPADPPSIGESITEALKELAASPIAKERNVRFKPWTSMSITGKSLIDEITKNINRADIFACDLTHPNHNVTFELGYAIARFKRIWLSLNTAFQDAPLAYKRIYSGLLSGLGYATYTNHKELVNALLTSPPWVDLNATPLGTIHRSRAPREERPTLLYIKPRLDTEAVIKTAEYLRSSVFGESLIIDDPKENPSPTLDWYAGKIRIADAVLIQSLATNHQDFSEHNLKCSFAAGLAHGFGKHLLITAHSPFDSPIDYKNLVAEHETAQQCLSLVRTWIFEKEAALPRRRSRRPREDTQAARALDLRRLSIGDPVAENEHHRLDEYFVETSAYFRALKDPTTILVGRRGTGKTAIFYALRSTLGSDKRNHVCVMKPVGYEIDGLVRVLSENLDRSESGYLVESLWKYLIFSELTISVFDELTERPIYAGRTADEEKLMTYVADRHESLCIPFSERLDRAVKTLTGVGELPSALQQRSRISEMLHSGELRDLRELLGAVLTDRQKVAILVDNLDEPWGHGQNFAHLSELLLGLLRVASDVSNEFQRRDHGQKPVNVSVTILLRSDIFALIQPLASEQDKFPLQRIYWDDPELLARVLDQRIVHAMPPEFTASAIWSHLFPSEVVGLPIRDFITRSVLPRPRDIIYLVGSAVDGAVNRGHQAVTPDDLLNARIRYSEFVFRSILAEDDPRKGKLESVLLEFAGAPKTVRLSDVRSRIQRAGVSESDIDFYIDLLCDVSFLGIQTTQGFSYALHESERRLMREVASRLATELGWGEESYQVNAAFYHILQID